CELPFVGVGSHYFQNLGINQGTVRFHNIVCKAEGVVFIVMMYAQGAKKPTCRKGSGHGRPQNDIAVVEVQVWVIAIAVALKRKVENMFPVMSCRSAFAVVGIAA